MKINTYASGTALERRPEHSVGDLLLGDLSTRISQAKQKKKKKINITNPE